MPSLVTRRRLVHAMTAAVVYATQDDAFSGIYYQRLAGQIEDKTPACATMTGTTACSKARLPF
jgi:hypothetical protein